MLEQESGMRFPAPKVAGIILAAGHSRRMAGRNKLLLTVGDMPIISHVVENAQASRLQQIIVVLGQDGDQISPLMPTTGLTIVDNTRFDTGIASSIRCGLRLVTEEMDAAMILLGDMPFITKSHINQLIAKFEPAQGRDIVVPVKQGRRGNPVPWGRCHFDKLRALNGDVGARDLLLEQAVSIASVEVNNEAILMDIDTPAALDEAREYFKTKYSPD